MTSLLVMRLISAPGKVEEGEILVDGNDLLKVSEYDMIHGSMCVGIGYR
ncbi:MAG: hypothetical protein WBL25_08720 [Anaerolineales bacterium]